MQAFAISNLNPIFDIKDESLVEFVNSFLEEAIAQSVSDIHIEPYIDQCRIRYRCDGLLYEKTTCLNEFAARVITRLKIMAKLDITEHRLPQDGRFQFKSTHIRFNSCPTAFGEKIVLRLVCSDKKIIDLRTLGLSEEQLTLLTDIAKRPHGMILVTGPTSSGKTLTLYSILQYLNHPEKNITSIEDPIEIQLTGINQLNTEPKINLNFANLLRAVLRQDPDIIMVGEIRDSETAEIAMQAATTGHLVLSSLHTNSAAETISRLTALGVKTTHIASAVSLIIAQRLIRKLCPHCKTLVKNYQYSAAGCQHCLNGYQGRIGIFELLPINEFIANSILANATAGSIRSIMLDHGYPLLHQEAHKKVLAGTTTIDEISRILMPGI